MHHTFLTQNEEKRANYKLNVMIRPIESTRISTKRLILNKFQCIFSSFTLVLFFVYSNLYHYSCLNENMLWTEWLMFVLNMTNYLLLHGTLCAICYHLYNLKNGKNTHEGVILLVKMQAEASNFIKSNIPPWVFFTFFKLSKWHQITQSITNG